MSGLHKFEINHNNSGIILATAGKYCDRNITVTANIDEQPLVEDATAQGELIGRQAAYDEFWDVFQQNGTRTDYMYAFRFWDDALYNPKYPVVISGDGSYAFRDVKITKRIAVYTSDCTKLDGMFAGAQKVSEIGTIDTTGCEGYIAGLFNACIQLARIEKLVLRENGSQTFSASFFNVCNALKDIVIEGTIGNTLTMQDCRSLSKDSITSVINALSSTTSGKTLTLSATAKNNAFTDDEWATLIATKSNWNISLV